jgi:hypothetical protein
MYDGSLERGSLPPTLTQGSIARPSCSSFRPLNLINVDVKVLVNVIARHLEVVLPGLISQEQTGFIKVNFLTLIV